MPDDPSGARVISFYHRDGRVTEIFLGWVLD
jgi:hypothetical protein